MPSSLAIVTPSFLTHLSDIVDTKARTEYERDRQKAHKGQDVRRKFNGKSSGTTTPKRNGLGHGAWRNSAIALEDMEDPTDLYDPIVIDDEDVGKENSRPVSSPRQLSVSLEELIIRPAASAVQAKKPRKAVTSRSSLSRQASSDNLATAFPSLSLTSPPSASLSIISESDFDPSLTPMQSPASSDSDDFDDDDCEFCSPGGDEWRMDEFEDGVRFVSSAFGTYGTFEKSDW